MIPSLPVDDERFRRMRGLTLLLALLIVGSCGLCGTMLWRLGASERAEAVANSHNLLIAEADEIDHLIAFYDGSLREAASLPRDPAPARGAAPAGRRVEAVPADAVLGPIRVLDAGGRAVRDGAEPRSAAARADEARAFARHRADPDLGLAIGPPFRTSSGAYRVTLSRRIDAPDGAFAGIVAGTIGLRHFVDQFRRLDIGPHNVVTLLRRDGTILAHIPGDALIGRSIAGSGVMRRFLSAPSGTFTGRSVIDGRTRMYAFDTVGDGGLILDVGMSTDDLYAPWRIEAEVFGVALAILSGCAALVLRAVRSELAQRIRAEEEAIRNETQYRLLADNVSDVIFHHDSDLVRTYASPSCRTLGYEPAELVGSPLAEWLHPDDSARVRAVLRALETDQSSEAIAYRARRRDGRYVWVEARYRRLPDGGLVGVLRDIDARIEVEAELERTRAELARLATLDGLTGIRNRRAFDDELPRQWRRADRERHDIALLIVDCDWFKDYNDLLGHQAGDAVLKAITAAMEGCLRRPGDMLARYGGEEFVAILPDTDPIGASGVAESIRAAVARLDMPHARSPLGRVTVSIGVAADTPRRSIDSADALLGLADEALYQAKAAGRDRVRCWTPSTARTAPERASALAPG